MQQSRKSESFGSVDDQTHTECSPRVHATQAKPETLPTRATSQPQESMKECAGGPKKTRQIHQTLSAGRDKENLEKERPVPSQRGQVRYSMLNGKYNRNPLIIKGEILGHGSFATVISAQRDGEEDLALKVVKTKDGRLPEKGPLKDAEIFDSRCTLKREVIALRRLMFCPYVVNLAAQPNYGTIKGQSFMLLQRLGPSIRDLLEKGHPFTEDIVIHVLQCASRALKTVHDQQFIYGDVKPANLVFATADLTSRVKLVDFDGRMTIVHARAIRERWGSAAYSSRRVNAHVGYRPHDDLESLCYVAFEMINGSLPWLSAASEEEMIVLKEKSMRQFMDKISGTLRKWMWNVWFVDEKAWVYKLHDRLEECLCGIESVSKRRKT